MNEEDKDISPSNHLSVITWHQIAFHYHNLHAPEPNESHEHHFERLQTQKRHMLRVASINRPSRSGFLNYIYRDVTVLLDRSGAPLQGFGNNMRILQLAHSLYIKVESRKEPLWPEAVVSGIYRLLPTQMPYLVNIVIETDALVSEEQYSGIGVDVVSKLHAPHLGAIHVIDLCKYSNEAHRHQCSVAIAVAGGLVKYMSSELRKVEIVGDTNQPAQYPFAYPVYTSFDLALQRELPQMSVSSLVFSDIGLVPQATRLIIACRRRLVSLKFLCCGLRLFNELFRATDRTPLVYPHLEELHGALSNNDDNTDAPIFPEGVLPRLVYLHEIAKHVWQYNRGVISHLLVDTLLTIVLPRLQLIRTRTSQAMSFALENVPSLTYVSYYMTSEFPERLGSRVVVGQFRRLLMHRGLQYLRFYDQVPPVQLSSAHLQIECIALKYLDMGVIIVSFEAVVFLLRALKQVHTFFCAINDGQLISQTMVAELGDRPVSESLRLLGFYIIGGSVSSSQQYHVATRRPSEEIYCRMPNLHQLQLQGGSSRACEFLNKQKKEHRFEWSGSVAERVEVLDVDLFARTKQ